MKKIIVMVLVLMMGAGVAVAADSTGFWGGLLKKLNTIVAHSPKGGSAYTSVVGVRGAEEDTASDALYWKGKDAPDVPVCSAEEVDAFKAAVLLAEQGNNQQALDAFNGFLETYPESKLCNDAMIAIDWIKSNAGG